jgi:hypothetical protein
LKLNKIKPTDLTEHNNKFWLKIIIKILLNKKMNYLKPDSEPETESFHLIFLLQEPINFHQKIIFNKIFLKPIKIIILNKFIIKPNTKIENKEPFPKNNNRNNSVKYSLTI